MNHFLDPFSVWLGIFIGLIAAFVIVLLLDKMAHKRAPDADTANLQIARARLDRAARAGAPVSPVSLRGGDPGLADRDASVGTDHAAHERRARLRELQPWLNDEQFRKGVK